MRKFFPATDAVVSEAESMNTRLRHPPSHSDGETRGFGVAKPINTDAESILGLTQTTAQDVASNQN